MRQTTGIILLEFLTGAVLFVGMVAALVAWRLVSGPTDLGFLKADVEKAMTDARDGKKVEIDKLSLRWMRDETEFKIVAEELRFLGEKGEVVGGADQAQIDLNAVALLAGKVELSEMVLENGTLSIQRNRSGEIRVADHVIPPFDPSLLPPDPTPVQIANFSVNNVLKNVKSSQSIQRLDRISLRAFAVTFVDESLLLDWTFEDVELDIEREGQDVSVIATGLPHGQGAPEVADFSTRLDLETGEFQIVLSLLNIEAMEFPALAFLQQKVSGRLKSDIVLQLEFDGAEIAHMSTTIETEAGEITWQDRSWPVGVNDFSLIYDVAGNSLELDGRAIDVSVFKGALLVQFPDAEKWFREPMSPHEVRIDSPELNFDFRPMFPDEWALRNASLVGIIDPAIGKLTYESARIGLDQISANSAGEIYLASNREEGDLPFGFRLRASTEGKVKPEQVLRFWPVRLGRTARSWVEENVRLGDLYDAEFQLDLAPDALRDDKLENEDLRLDFSFRNADVSFLSDLPSITQAAGRARLEGNRFSVDVSEGRFSNWVIDTGSVQIPQFKPAGGIMTVKAHGSGPVRDIVETISNSRLQLAEKYGLKIDSVSGEGEADFKLTRPLASNVSDDATRFEAEGRIRNGGFENIFTDISLKKTTAVVKVDNDRLRLNGYGEFLNTPVQFDWEELFDPDVARRTRLTARGNVTSDLLNRFGISARAYLTGDIFTRMNARGPSLADLDVVNLDFDLTPNRLDFRELDWIKPAGKNAKAELRYRSVKGDQQTAVKMAADGLSFDGNLKMSEAGKIDGILLNRLFLAKQLDISGELAKTETGGLLVDIKGPFLNASSFLDGMMASGSGATPIFGQVAIRSKIDRLRMKEGLELTTVDLSADFDGPDLRSVALSGGSREGGKVELSLRAGEADQRVLDIAVSDAGGMLEGLFGMDFVEGGTLTASGLLDDRQNGSADLLVTIKNARLRNAPLLTQILSLASPRGLTDVMSGDGILFTDVRLPIRIDEQGYYLKGAKASGPAMGFTSNGHILDNGQHIVLDGVLVPSFGVNSALGGIPIIGDLFVSRDGEGVFAITYGVRGSLSEAKVSVNPLSGLVPGVLRRIFENPVEPLPEGTGTANDVVPSE